ncbi:MAG: trypsin-like serine protease [Clostridiales bacterium]|nr:trypsin-like serine protease [Clostridiales bacterium]
MSFYYEDPENENREEEIIHYTPVERIERPKPPKKEKGSFLRFITTVVLAGILSSAITMGVFYWYLPEIIEKANISTVPPSNITIEPEHDYTVYSAVAEKAMPSVVGITTVTLERDIFFGTRRSKGLGTGVIIDERGYILTNSHVVGDGNVEEVMVLFHDGSSLPAEVLWNEVTLDLAIIKVNGGKNLQPAELGDSDSLRVGEIAVAIGNPLGLNFERTLTQGVISGLNRSITVGQGQTIENLIQTDASINPGNSGGPLLNAKGQVIGINTAKIQTGEGLGFSIPINTAKPIVDQFIEQGEFTRVYLGIRGMNVDGFQGRTGIELGVNEGVYVVAVEPNSVADTYDIRSGDIIIGIGGNKVDTMGALTRELYKFRPGDKTTVKVMRNQRELNIEVTL